MKNIHVISTDKPSRLVLSNNSILSIIAESNYNFSHIKSVHIYITSDEEIKDGDWFISLYSNSIQRELTLDWTLNKDAYKKIILTTDPDLIQYNVQAIDDKFLEWFVKNPSCEEVDVANSLVRISSFDWRTDYKIIIPKEEPKQEFPQFGTKEFNDLASTYFGGKPKQETLEEAAKILYPENWESIMDGQHDSNSYERNAFIKGAKLQAERIGLMEIELNHTKRLLASCEKALEERDKQIEERHSEEDFKLFARQYYREIKLSKSNLLWDELADKCFEQFKKK